MSEMNWPSPSQQQRVEICASSAVLPQVKRVGDDQWQSRGIVIHGYLYDVLNHGVPEALNRLREKGVEPELIKACELIDLNALPASSPEAYAAEVTIAWNIDTGEAREVGRGLKREEISALLGPREISGTLDVVGLGPDIVDVIDYKTGHHRYGAPQTVKQLRSYALHAARAYGKPRARVRIARINEAGEVHWATGTMDEFDIATREVELQEMVARIEIARDAYVRGVRLVPVEGEHCARCPAFNSCPAKMALIRAAAGVPDDLEKEIRAAILSATDEQLASAYWKINALEKVVDRAKDILKDRARRTAFPVGDGYVYGAREEDQVNAEVAPEVLAVLYGEEVAKDAVETKTTISKASIERAVRKHVLKPGMKITHVMRSTVETLREAGGIVRAETVERFKPKETKEAAPADSASA